MQLDLPAIVKSFKSLDYYLQSADRRTKEYKMCEKALESVKTNNHQLVDMFFMIGHADYDWQNCFTINWI